MSCQLRTGLDFSRLPGCLRVHLWDWAPSRRLEGSGQKAGGLARADAVKWSEGSCRVLQGAGPPRSGAGWGRSVEAAFGELAVARPGPPLLPQQPQRGETTPSDMLPSLQTPLQCSPGRTTHQAVSMPRRPLIFKGSAQLLRCGWRLLGSWPPRPWVREAAGPGDPGLEGSGSGS